MNDTSIESASCEELQEALLHHYDRSARELPWRRDTDPYRVLVSEIMLQQTRVETVKGYYERWLERFPALDDLACAEEEEVLKAWEGLGYYRRARNLHRAARVVREEHGGVIPTDSAGLLMLPGVGEYTAGAVASISFGERTPAVDGNVRRVLARLFDVSAPKPAWLRETAAGLVNADRPSDWNQALMELGATVCTPGRPDCDACPVSRWCRARAAGTQNERPVVIARRPVPKTAFALAVLHHEGRVLITKRPDQGLLAGMWSFPESRLEARAPKTGARGVAIRLAEELGYTAAAATELPTCRHRFTHLEALYIPWSIEVLADSTSDPGFAWLDPYEPDHWALPVAQRKVLTSWVTRGTETENV
jgi:A/G-specific adenine glycosylase